MEFEYYQIVFKFLLGILLLSLSPFPLLFKMWYLTLAIAITGAYLIVTSYRRGKELQELS